MRHTLYACTLALCLILLSACAPSENVFILLPDPDGSVGFIQVENEQGKVLIAEAGQTVTVKDQQTAPEIAEPMPEQHIQEIFGTVIERAPQQPAKFLLYFLSNSTTLTPDSKALIPKVLEAISSRTSMDISITGHSDRSGASSYNKKLSFTRAQAVRDILLTQSVDRKMIDVASHGEGNPLILTADGVSEPRNRRVEIIIK